jgi:hypothetical protein
MDLLTHYLLNQHWKNLLTDTSLNDYTHHSFIVMAGPHDLRELVHSDAKIGYIVTEIVM